MSYLTEELVALGHEVTLFASGDSITSARLEAPIANALRLQEGPIDPVAAHVMMLEGVAAEASRFDVIHFHTDSIHLPLARRIEVPGLTTLHGRLDLAYLMPLYAEFAEAPLVSISRSQTQPLPTANWQGTVLHGLPPSLYELGPGDGGYLAFLGRISPEKGPEAAIEMARRAGVPLRVAAKVDAADRAYFEARVAPLLRQPHVEFVGEVGEDEKQDFLGRAKALLFPIAWDEPFGMVMIESMACGTPVVAFNRGSVPEVIENGVTGFVVDSLEAGIEAIGRTRELDRARCRAAFEARFTSRRMAREYDAIYRALAERHSVRRDAA